MAGPKLLAAFADAYPRAFFVEVGSNDGDKHDHLRPFILTRGWSGIMVEPVPYIFERLRSNYGHVEGVTLENVAIADHEGRLPFFYVVEPREDDRDVLPEWYDGIGSFSREAVMRHAPDIPDIESRVVEGEVPCLSFEALCHRNAVERVDLLLVDTEGFDWQIIRTVDLDAHRPRVIVYEHYHLQPGERRECLAHLAAAGYETLEEGFDTFCLDTRVDDPVTAAWRRLKPAVKALSVHDETR